MTPEQFRSLLMVLHRIADAFEEQNRANAENIAQNKAWRDEEEQAIQQRRSENMAIEQERIEIERHILALHRANAEREESHREKIRQTQEAQARDTNALNHQAFETWLESFTQQKRDKA